MGAHNRKEIAQTLGPFDFGEYPFSFNVVKQFIFIRHGEKPPKEQMTGNLSDMSIFRANNLYRVLGPGNTPVGYDTPDVIYAMKAKPGDTDASNRPFETVQPLAIRLGMDPREGQRTPATGGDRVFDNQYTRKDYRGLKDDVEAHCSNGDYRDKTVMFCWEHKTIPYIVAKFGLTTDELSWGLDPIAGEDDNANFTAIWVFTPSENSFKVYQNFSISGDSPADFRVRSPPDIGYEVYSSSMLREDSFKGAGGRAVDKAPHYPESQAPGSHVLQDAPAPQRLTPTHKPVGSGPPASKEFPKAEMQPPTMQSSRDEVLQWLRNDLQSSQLGHAVPAAVAQSRSAADDSVADVYAIDREWLSQQPSAYKEKLEAELKEHGFFQTFTLPPGGSDHIYERWRLPLAQLHSMLWTQQEAQPNTIQNQEKIPVWMAISDLGSCTQGEAREQPGAVVPGTAEVPGHWHWGRYHKFTYEPSINFAVEASLAGDQLYIDLKQLSIQISRPEDRDKGIIAVYVRMTISDSHSRDYRVQPSGTQVLRSRLKESEVLAKYAVWGLDLDIMPTLTSGLHTVELSGLGASAHRSEETVPMIPLGYALLPIVSLGAESGNVGVTGETYSYSTICLSRSTLNTLAAGELDRADGISIREQTDGQITFVAKRRNSEGDSLGQIYINFEAMYLILPGLPRWGQLVNPVAKGKRLPRTVSFPRTVLNTV